ncbi:hypothetical protein APHAL10511_002272 [Amanita phalloides]|nr:hypothetical protein APHAL10511_002272 [Amanita phalloides]
MMKTRRRSKAATAASAEASQVEESHPFTIVIPEDVDVDALSSLVPDADFSAPNSDVVLSVYRLLLQHAIDLNATQRELDEARAEAERKDVELDQALQDRETMSKDLEQAVESARTDVEKSKLERDQLSNAQSALQMQITTLQASQTSSTAEVDTLRTRVDDVEREKRDLVGVISRLKQESEQREEEIQTLRANLKEARQEHQGLEAQTRELRSVEASTKFKVETLNQQLQLAQTEADRTANELGSKTEEYSKYRRSKSAELSSLQASYDSLKQSHESAQASLKALQVSHTSQSHHLTQALAKVQDLTGQLAEQEATYVSESNGLRRLVAMMEEREQQAKEIVESIEKEWAGVGEKAEKREAVLKDEIERERRAREDAEKRIYHLETVLDRMGRGELPPPGRSTPSTPLRTPRTSDATTEAMMGLSPTVAMASKTQKSGKTFTEVYADYVRLQDEYAQKCAEYDHMDRTLTAVLAQIEERAPIISQQRTEYERLKSEASELASQLAQAITERETQSNLAQDNTQKLNKSLRENGLLQKQLEDLGRQVQSLLREITRRDDPTLINTVDEEVQPLAAEDTDTLITNNLVLFKSIRGLQEQNQKLLRIVRELSSKMETEEREYKEAMEREQSEAIREAHEAMQELAAQLERQKKNSENVIQAYVKERDALKAMLARAEKASSSSLAGINGNSAAVSGGEGQSDLARELAEVQSQFDAYRTEMGIDSVRLREDLVGSQREIAQLGTALAKANAKIEYLTDRHRMHQDQFALHAKEIDDLTKRNQKLFDQWTRIDIECSRATEDLQIANGRMEQLRNECANLRAEKKIWEGVQSRLVEDNKTLALERAHLSDLMTNVQKMHGDLERSGENDRRRLESQLQMLESQTQDLRAQLVQERDTIRHVNLQKEIELKELQIRLDKNTQELSKTREGLVGAETSKKHLEERITDLNRQIQGSEEKLAVYERRPTAANASSQNIDQGLSREQQLESEVAELRSALKVAELDLATSKGHVQQFKEISQASEEALANLNSTYDEYKISTEAQIARQEAEHAALQERLKEVREELSQLRGRHDEIRKTFDTERTAWASDKKTLEDTIIDLSTSEKNAETDRSSRENEIRHLEERTKAAEDRYSNEVVSHADSIKSVESLKRELASAHATARDNLRTVETAQTKLASSENSWKQQKEALDKEIADLNTRCKDLSDQNKLLHQHLESVSSQAARIRQAADSSASTQVEGDPSEDKFVELRQVVQYLRKEKEIVDLQLELSKQENARFKGQVDHLSHALDVARATLSEERERALETAASASQHAELVERINQLNILRESNATLRADCENHAKRARELENKLKQSSQELEPAKEQSRAVQAELEASKAHILRLEEENRRWQERNSQLLSKYDRVDPAEIQSLKDEIESLKAQKAEVEQQKADLENSRKEVDSRVEALESTIRNSRENQNRLNQRIRTQIGELNNEKGRILEEKRTLEAKVTTLEQQLNEAQSKVSEASAQPTQDQSATIAALQAERDRLLAEKATLDASRAPVPMSVATDIEETKRSWETEKTELLRARDDALTKLKAAAEEAQKAAEDVKNIRFQNEKFQKRLQDMTKAKSVADSDREAAVTSAVEKAKAEFEKAGMSTTSEESKRHAEELRALGEKLKVQHHEELQLAVENARKEQANSGVGPDRKAAIDAAVAEHTRSLESKHAEDIEAAMERGRMEQTMKSKVKDAQLVKVQKRVKELEAQVQKWKDAGYIPADEQTSTPTTTTAPAPVPPVAKPAATPPPQAGSAGAPPPGAAAVRRPVPTGPTAGAGRGASIRGQPRGGPRASGLPPRGGAPARPAATGLSIAGASAAATAAAPAPNASQPGTLHIAGASKRPREEQAGAGDDALAKRLRPAVDVPAKPPVPRRQPPQQTQPPAS